MLSRLELEIFGVIIILGLGYGLWVRHDDVEQAKGAEICQAKIDAVIKKDDAEAAEKEKAYADRVQINTAIYTSALHNLPTAITTPVIINDGVRNPDSVCPATVASISSKTPGVHPDTSGVQPGPGDRDIRAGIEAFKVRYEKSLLGCQEILDDWPNTGP